MYVGLKRFGLVKLVCLVLYISNILLGRSNFADSVYRFGSIDLVWYVWFGKLISVPRQIVSIE